MKKKLITTKIQIPALPKSFTATSRMLWRYDKFNVGFSRIKYVFILKLDESKKARMKRNMWYYRREYGIGILTEENDYYFSTLSTNHMYLDGNQVNLFNKIFTERFIINEDSRILFSDNIDFSTEPIALFWSSVKAGVPCRFTHASLNRIFKCVNRLHRTVRVWKRRKFGPWHYELLIAKLFKNKSFGFITDPDWEEKLKTMNERLRDAHVYVAVGILYLDTMDMYMAIHRRNVKRRAERKLEEQRRLEEGEPEMDPLDKRDSAPWDVVM